MSMHSFWFWFVCVAHKHDYYCFFFFFFVCVCDTVNMLPVKNGIFCCTSIFRATFQDVRSKRLLERRQKGSHKTMDFLLFEGDDGRLADGAGLAGTFSVPRDSQDRWKREKEEKEEEMLALLREQEERRIARREAFLKWQVGQREKGAAHRLTRQAKSQEKFKRHHYHSQRGRLIPVSLLSEDNDCKGNAHRFPDSSLAYLPDGRGRATNLLAHFGSFLDEQRLSRLQ